jgi:two-component system LytT family response regulator
MSQRLRAIVVDDAPVAREHLEALLGEAPDVDVVASCASGRQAVAAIEAERPDLVFLDLQMPAMNGFEVIREIGPDRMPAVILVTAHDQYAVDAFDVPAIDYLLKPFSRPRFERALDRARLHFTRLRAGLMADRLNALVKDLDDPGQASERLMIRSGVRIVYLSPDQIDWIEATGNYVTFHVGVETYLYRETMERMIERFGSSRFLRVHRGHGVNLASVRELRRLEAGRYEVILKNGTRLPLGRLYRDALRRRLTAAAPEPSR